MVGIHLANQLSQTTIYQCSLLQIEPPPREEETSTERTLPLDRYTEEFEYGFKESKVIPRGKVSLAQALKFITDHHSNPTEWTIEKIAKQYKMKDYVAGK